MADPIGLIAGKGSLPVLLIRSLKERGLDTVAITFDRETEEKILPEATHTHRIGVGQAGKVIKTLKKAGVKEIALAGKVDKRVLFENPKFDLKALSILGKLSLMNDDSLMLGIVNELEKEGLCVASQVELFRDLMPGPGQLSKRAPDERERNDMEFGMKMAKGIAALDIGQTVIVRDNAIMAVEAIEGTDEAIERGGRLAKEGAVVCKVSKPNQDPRFDVPAIGVGTIEKMAEVGATALAIEANETLVVDLEATVIKADQKSISIIAI
jgi:hypothetical protein